MAECEDWVDDGNLLNVVLVCNGGNKCGHKVGPSQPMVCDCCAAKFEAALPMKVTYAKSKPWTPPPHYKQGQCRCDCHDRNMRHFALCCDQTYVARAEMKPHAPRPPVVIGDFTKFTMPVIRKP